MEKKLSAEEQMKQDIYQAIGHGSVCWSKPPAGEFDSLEATAAAEILWSKVQEYVSQFKGEAVSDAVEETNALNKAYHKKILRQNIIIKELRMKLQCLINQQLDVCWEIEADRMGLDEETQKEINKMADNVFKAVADDKAYIQGLKKENDDLKAKLYSLEIQLELTKPPHKTRNNE